MGVLFLLYEVITGLSSFVSSWALCSAVRISQAPLPARNNTRGKAVDAFIYFEFLMLTAELAKNPCPFIMASLR